MEIQFSLDLIPDYASRYSYPRSDASLNILAAKVRVAGHFTRDHLLEIVRWKSPRTISKAERNQIEFVAETSRVAVSTKSERLRVEVLTLLDGVDWPMASVLLHFCIDKTYPILDVRALWSVGVTVQHHQYNYALWEAYVSYCRQLAQASSLSVRDLDKALWQYSKEKQGPANQAL